MCPAACIWEHSILPRLPMGACDVAGLGCMLGTCCQAGTCCRAGFLYARRGVSSGSLLTCSASPCSGIDDACLFFLFGARVGAVILSVPRRVPFFDAVVALVTCARLLTPLLPLIPIPTMSAAPVVYQSSCDCKPGISRALLHRSARGPAGS